MVFQGILGKLGLSGVSGLAQGGGFGLGYGFMVRAGYDLYGQMRDKVLGALTGQRYTPGTATSMAGTGGIMGLSRTDPGTDTHTLNTMTQSQQERLWKMSGGKRKGGVPLVYAQKQAQKSSQPSFRQMKFDINKERARKYYKNKDFYDTFNIKL